MQVERPQLTKEELARHSQRECAKQYYHHNKEHVLQQKKQWYAEKHGTKYLNHLKPIYLSDLSRRESNLRVKMAFKNKKLILKINDKKYTPEQFYECFTFNYQFINAIRNYEYTPDEILTITIDENILTPNCVMI